MRGEIAGRDLRISKSSRSNAHVGGKGGWLGLFFWLLALARFGAKRETKSFFFASVQPQIRAKIVGPRPVADGGELMADDPYLRRREDEDEDEAES